MNSEHFLDYFFQVGLSNADSLMDSRHPIQGQEDNGIQIRVKKFKKKGKSYIH